METGVQSLLVRWPQHWTGAPGCTEGAEETQIGKGLDEGNDRRATAARTLLAWDLNDRSTRVEVNHWLQKNGEDWSECAPLLEEPDRSATGVSS
jgi:hypothetical protein